MKPSAARKQLLIAESEVNRTLLISDLTELKQDVQSFTKHAGTLVAIASAAASLIAGLAALHRSPETAAARDPKPPWLKGLFTGAGWLASLWRHFRSGNEHQEQPGHAEQNEKSGKTQGNAH